MNFDTKTFVASLPDFFHPLWSELEGRGLVATFVGGTVRDYLLTGKLGKDWDIELTHQSLAFHINTWKELGKALSKYGRSSFLPYEIIRLELHGHQLEFSPPRREIFHDHLKDEGHKNFAAELDFGMSFPEAVIRRDFTINAMGIRLNTKSQSELLDPLGGIIHLRDKVLHPCGPDFARDPVRFLRALRFSQALDFTIGTDLEKTLESMNLTGISPVYLWSEMQKSRDPIGFYQELLHWLPRHPELRLPIGAEALMKLPEMRKILSKVDKHEAWMIAWEWVGISCESWQQFFSLSSESSRRLAGWARSSKVFQNILPEIFHGDFEAVLELKDFETLFNWYFTTKHLLQKNPELPLMSMIQQYLPEWIHLYRFEPLKDVKHIDPPKRAKYQVWNLCQRL